MFLRKDEMPRVKSGRRIIEEALEKGRRVPLFLVDVSVYSMCILAKTGLSFEKGKQPFYVCGLVDHHKYGLEEHECEQMVFLQDESRGSASLFSLEWMIRQGYTPSLREEFLARVATCTDSCCLRQSYVGQLDRDSVTGFLERMGKPRDHFEHFCLFGIDHTRSDEVLGTYGQKDMVFGEYKVFSSIAEVFRAGPHTQSALDRTVAWIRNDVHASGDPLKARLLVLRRYDIDQTAYHFVGSEPFMAKFRAWREGSPRYDMAAKDLIARDDEHGTLVLRDVSKWGRQAGCKLLSGILGW